jgi:hypothetical protein
MHVVFPTNYSEPQTCGRSSTGSRTYSPSVALFLAASTLVGCEASSIATQASMKTSNDESQSPSDGWIRHVDLGVMFPGTKSTHVILLPKRVDEDPLMSAISSCDCVQPRLIRCQDSSKSIRSALQLNVDAGADTIPLELQIEIILRHRSSIETPLRVRMSKQVQVE